jgi:hypothetical protein
MRANVYTDKSLERYAGRFVWLSINTEAPESAAFLKKYPIPALPTLLVLDRETQRCRGALRRRREYPQVRGMLDDAEQRYRSRSEATADQLLASADSLASDGKHAEAAKAYDSRSKNAPSRAGAGFGRTAESLIIRAVDGERQRAVRDARAGVVSARERNRVRGERRRDRRLVRGRSRQGA